MDLTLGQVSKVNLLGFKEKEVKYALPTSETILRTTCLGRTPEQTEMNARWLPNQFEPHDYLELGPVLCT